MAGGDDDAPPPPPRPGDYITPTRLTIDNYDSWAADVQLALEARRKFGFLDGTITTPIPPCTQADWTAINAMLISWITNTIDPTLKSTLSKFREAKSLWDHLKHRFAQSNGPRIQQLRSLIARCEQSKSMTVSEYYGKLHNLWQELDIHDPIISCSCCTAGTQHEHRRSQTRLHQFLMGLQPDYYSPLRSQILSQDPLPSIERAYQLLIHEERVRSAKQESDISQIEAVGFAATTGLEAASGVMRGKSRNGEKPYCTRCRRTGHEAASCWANVTCAHCKKKGHPESHCFEIVGRPNNKKQGQTRGSAHANMTSSPQSSSNTTLTSLFTPEQWKAIAGLVGNSNIPENRLTGKFDVFSWIIDTGATHQVTGNISWLFDTHNFDYD